MPPRQPSQRERRRTRHFGSEEPERDQGDQQRRATRATTKEDEETTSSFNPNLPPAIFPSLPTDQSEWTDAQRALHYRVHGRIQESPEQALQPARTARAHIADSDDDEDLLPAAGPTARRKKPITLSDLIFRTNKKWDQNHKKALKDKPLKIVEGFNDDCSPEEQRYMSDIMLEMETSDEEAPQKGQCVQFQDLYIVVQARIVMNMRNEAVVEQFGNPLYPAEHILNISKAHAADLVRYFHENVLPHPGFNDTAERPTTPQLAHAARYLQDEQIPQRFLKDPVGPSVQKLPKDLPSSWADADIVDGMIPADQVFFRGVNPKGATALKGVGLHKNNTESHKIGATAVTGPSVINEDDAMVSRARMAEPLLDNGVYGSATGEPAMSGLGNIMDTGVPPSYAFCGENYPLLGIEDMDTVQAFYGDENGDGMPPVQYDLGAQLDFERHPYDTAAIPFDFLGQPPAQPTAAGLDVTQPEPKSTEHSMIDVPMSDSGNGLTENMSPSALPFDFFDQPPVQPTTAGPVVTQSETNSTEQSTSDVPMSNSGNGFAEIMSLPSKPESPGSPTVNRPINITAPTAGAFRMAYVNPTFEGPSQPDARGPANPPGFTGSNGGTSYGMSSRNPFAEPPQPVFLDSGARGHTNPPDQTASTGGGSYAMSSSHHSFAGPLEPSGINVNTHGPANPTDLTESTGGSSYGMSSSQNPFHGPSQTSNLAASTDGSYGLSASHDVFGRPSAPPVPESNARVSKATRPHNFVPSGRSTGESHFVPSGHSSPARKKQRTRKSAPVTRHILPSHPQLEYYQGSYLVPTTPTAMHYGSHHVPSGIPEFASAPTNTEFADTGYGYHFNPAPAAYSFNDSGTASHASSAQVLPAIAPNLNGNGSGYSRAPSAQVSPGTVLDSNIDPALLMFGAPSNVAAINGPSTGVFGMLATPSMLGRTDPQPAPMPSSNAGGSFDFPNHPVTSHSLPVTVNPADLVTRGSIMSAPRTPVRPVIHAPITPLNSTIPAPVDGMPTHPFDFHSGLPPMASEPRHYRGDSE